MKTTSFKIGRIRRNAYLLRSNLLLPLVTLLLCKYMNNVTCFSLYKFKQNPLFIRSSNSFLFQTSDVPDEEGVGISSESSTSIYETINITLTEHKPLGCSIEESLSSIDQKAVFVSKVLADGIASKAGIQKGDVIVKVSGVFGTYMEDVSTLVGVKRIKDLILGCPEEDELKLQLVRGTDVINNHEEALLQLCSVDGNDTYETDDGMVGFDNSKAKKLLNNCLQVINSYDYDAGVDDDEEEEEKNQNCINEDENSECLLDAAFDLWNSELEQPQVQEDVEKVDEVQKPDRPWAQRSSFSGTYVRDPVTGEMKNIG